MNRDLFANAIVSIELGVEDIQNSDNRRLTSAVRNLYAGLLLLFKCVLEENSPIGSDGALIYREIQPVRQPDGTVVFRGKGKKTVDRRDIQDRLTSLGFAFDWKRLDAIASIRNDMEHLHSTKPKSLAEKAFSDALLLIVDIIDVHLQRRPAQVFKPQCWDFLKKNSEVFGAASARSWSTLEKLGFNSSLQRVAMQHLQCPDCGSSLVKQRDPHNEDITQLELVCSECGEHLDLETVFVKGLEAATYRDAYLAATQGGEPPLRMCEECYRFTVCTDEGICTMPNCSPPPGNLYCASCGDEIEPRQMSTEHGVCMSCAFERENL